MTLSWFLKGSHTLTVGSPVSNCRRAREARDRAGEEKSPTWVLCRGDSWEAFCLEAAFHTVGMTEIHGEEVRRDSRLRPGALWEQGEPSWKRNGRASAGLNGISSLFKRMANAWKLAVVWAKWYKNRYFSLTKCLRIWFDLLCRQYPFKRVIYAPKFRHSN